MVAEWDSIWVNQRSHCCEGTSYKQLRHSQWLRLCYLVDIDPGTPAQDL
jgi:hypothetical protein